ncbi:MAG: sensor histidine kinase, partial [Chloroflexota bacterium]
VVASRIEGGQLPLKRQPVDMGSLVRAAADRFRGAHDGRALRVEVGDVPPVEGDPGRLEQIVDNLLSNAAKYSPPEQAIRLAMGVVEGRLVMTVQDSGVGIAPEHLPYVFNRFYRAPGADTARVKGLGLGLSIVRDLVAAHGGRVWVESAGPGKGSTFHVSLPTASPIPAEPARA